MQISERPQFKACFSALVLTLKLPADEKSAQTLRAKEGAYFSALQDIPIHAVVGAAQILQRTGSPFFPATTEWYSIAADVAHKAIEASPVLQLAAAHGDGTAWEQAKAAKAMCVETWRTVAEKKPTLAMWLRAIEKTPCRDPDTDPNRVYCLECRDSGLQKCTPKDGASLTVTRCSCVPRNPVITRRHALMGRGHDQPTA